MMDELKIPVLLIAFNRPECVTVTFEYIRRAKPTKLYVALDGARKNKLYEDIVCNEVKNIVQRVDWDCEVKYKINTGNLGAEVTVSEAIKWVFETEEYVIILEDDTVAPISFFRFAQEMLLKYKDDERIKAVTSINKGNDCFGEFDYTFAKYGHSPCFAIWKRTWKNFNLNIEIKDEHLEYDYIQKQTYSKKEALYYQTLFKKMKERGRGNNTWDLIWLYINFVQGRKLSIIPRVNLSSNIGVVGLHARGRTNLHYRVYDENFEVKKHPEEVKCNEEFDKFHFEKHIIPKTNLLLRITGKLDREMNRIFG